MAKPRKTSAVPAAAEDFASFVATFKEQWPDDWEALRLCPLQHGLDAMEAKLRG